MYDTFVLFREGDAVGIYRSEHVSKWIPQNSPNFFISRNKMTYYHLLLPPKKLSKRWSEGMDFPWQSFLLVRWLWLGWSSEPWRSTIHCGVWRHACASDAESNLLWGKKMSSLAPQHHDFPKAKLYSIVQLRNGWFCFILTIKNRGFRVTTCILGNANRHIYLHSIFGFLK